MDSDALRAGLTLAGLIDAADLYFHLIRRRARWRREVREQHEAGLRSLVRVLLTDAEHPTSGGAPSHPPAQVSS